MSIIDSIRQYIYRRRLLRHPRQEAAFPMYTQLRSALVLYQSDIMEKNPAIKAIRDQLLKQDIDVTLWGFADKKEATSPILPQSRVLCHKDLNIWSEPKSDVIDDLQKRQYDLLIDLTQQPCLPLHYLALYARATFKTGANITEGIHHFMVSTPAQEEPTFLYKQIMYYLKNISSND